MKNIFFVSILLILCLFAVSLQNGCGKVVKQHYPVPAISDINGGISGSGTVKSLFIISGIGFGNLSSQKSGFSVDFRDPTTSAITSATIDYAAGNWKDIYIKGTVPDTLSTSTTYKVTVTTPGGTSNAVNFLVVQSVSFSPSTIAWSATSSLPTAIQGFPSVVAAISGSSYIYALGGNTSSAAQDNKTLNQSTVYFNQMNDASGALANPTWEATTPLPAPRSFSCAVIANAFNSLVSGNGRIYLMGGLDGGGNATDEVFAATLNSDGTVGTWETTTPLPQPLFASSAVLFFGRIYVAGGNSAAGSPVTSVYSARINSDGSLGTWQTMRALPQPRAYHRMVVIAGFLYVIGGDSTATNPISNIESARPEKSVYYNQINIINGSLVGAAWSSTSSLIKELEKHTAVAAGSHILVSGGLYNGAKSGASEQTYATINSDGSLTPFGGAKGDTILGSGGYNFYNHSSAYFVDKSGMPHVLILGGGDVVTGLLHSEVWYQY